MDQTRIHLFITHLPVFGTALALIVLLLGMRWKNDQTIKASFYVLLVTALGAAVAYITGEWAESTVEGLAGVSENDIEAHEDSAKITLIVFIIAGLASIAGLFLKNGLRLRRMTFAIMLLAAVGLGVGLRTASLGGAIRHTELKNPPVKEVPQENGTVMQNDHDDEDED